MALLEVTNLGISFGGLRAVNALIFRLKKKNFTADRTEWGGKTTVFNLLTGVYKPDSGKVLLDGTDITGRRRLISASRELPEHFRISVCSSSSACWIT